MPIRRLVAVLALAGLATGCGGAREGKGTTELKAYLSRVLVEQQRYERTRTLTFTALTHASATAPDGTWAKSAKQLLRAEHEYAVLVGRMTAITAPAALRAQHAGMVESLQLYRQLVTNVERPLGKRDVVALGRTLSLTTKLGIRANELRIRWRIRAEETARRLGIPFPATLDHVGRPMKKHESPLNA